MTNGVLINIEAAVIFLLFVSLIILAKKSCNQLLVQSENRVNMKNIILQ